MNCKAFAVYKKFNKNQVRPDDLLGAAILAVTAKTIFKLFFCV